MKTVTELYVFKINDERAVVGSPKLKVESNVPRGTISLQFGTETKYELSASELLTAIDRATLER